MNSSSLDNNMSSQNLWGKNKETFINGKNFQKPKNKSESEDKTPVLMLTAGQGLMNRAILLQHFNAYYDYHTAGQRLDESFLCRHI